MCSQHPCIDLDSHFPMLCSNEYSRSRGVRGLITSSYLASNKGLANFERKKSKDSKSRRRVKSRWITLKCHYSDQNKKWNMPSYWQTLQHLIREKIYFLFFESYHIFSIDMARRSRRKIDRKVTALSRFGVRKILEFRWNKSKNF